MYYPQVLVGTRVNHLSPESHFVNILVKDEKNIPTPSPSLGSIIQVFLKNGQKVSYSFLKGKH